MAAADKQMITLGKYQDEALSTDQNRSAGLGGIRFPILGLFGEVGSLLAEAKKKQRDSLNYEDFRDVMMEEFGDALWYFSNLASRTDTSLQTLATTVPRGKSKEPRSQSERHSTGSSEELQAALIRLAGEVGVLVDRFGGEADSSHEATVTSHLPKVFLALSNAASVEGIDLREAAEKNLRKTRDRWPGMHASSTPLFDDVFDLDEQIPREIKMLFEEKKVGGKTYVIQKCKGIKIGDRLTDNMTADDGYRYHDIFHLAFAAVLGWSPVIRALFKCKRKSDSMVDEVQDGARAVVIEEGVSAWVFNHASRHRFFEGMTRLDYDLLKRVKSFVRGFEVEQCAAWEWENAIVKGYEVFRNIRKNHGGMIHTNLLRRTISVES
jgi:NTP pyrophosphatase (non-canonical NTP hydrolase)